MNIDIQMSRLFRVRMPTIVRYMDDKHVEQFFGSGRLMLSTLNRCRNFEEEEIRRDNSEGTSRFDVSDGGMGLSSVISSAESSFMLCASTEESERLAARFCVNNYIKINDVVGFANAISRRIPGFGFCELGACVYEEDKIHRREGDLSFTKDFAKLMTNDGLADGDVQVAFREMNKRISQEIDEGDPSFALFHKPLQFSAEAEYRIVWSVPYLTKDPLFIECPEAARFCESGKFKEKYKKMREDLLDRPRARGYFSLGGIDPNKSPFE